MSKKKLFGRSLEEISQDKTVQEMPLDKDGWKEEIRQATQKLELTKRLDYHEILNKYFPLHSSGNDFTTAENIAAYVGLGNEIDDYIKANEKSFGLCVMPDRKVYRADFIDKIKKIGDRQIEATGSTNEHNIAVEVLKKDDDVRTVVEILRMCHDEFNWRRKDIPETQIPLYVAK
jgi:hypothetical protein